MIIARKIIIPIFSVFILCSCNGGRWSEEWEEKFESFQPSGKIMDVIGVEPGEIVGEIGAGNGRFAVKVADRVGREGLVYANDIDGKAVDFMEERCRRQNITNMRVIHSRETDPGFPDAKLDLVYIINTYDHLSDPVTLLRNTAPALKPSGRLAIIATDSRKLKDHRGHATPREVVLEQAADAGFELVAMDTTFLYDNIYLFRIAMD